jgi:hypothetical protein
VPHPDLSGAGVLGAQIQINEIIDTKTDNNIFILQLFIRDEK